MDASAIQVAVLLAVVVKAVLDGIARPLHTKYPQLDLWWFDYVALVVGGLTGWFANINLFTPALTNIVLGRILTAFVVGGGAKLINDIFAVWQGTAGSAPVVRERDLLSPAAPATPAPKRTLGW